MDEEKKYDPYTGYEVTKEQEEKKPDGKPETFVVGEGSYQMDETLVEGSKDTTEGATTGPSYHGEPTNSSKSTVSMILGILAILFTCCCPPIGLILGVVAIVLGVIAPKVMNKMDGKSVAGIICGAIGILLTIVIIIFAVIVGTSPAFQREMQHQMQEEMQSTAYESDDF